MSAETWTLHADVPYEGGGLCDCGCANLSVDCRLVLYLEQVMAHGGCFAGTFISSTAGRDERTIQWSFDDGPAARRAAETLLMYSSISSMPGIRTSVQEPGKRFAGWMENKDYES